MNDFLVNIFIYTILGSTVGIIFSFVFGILIDKWWERK